MSGEVAHLGGVAALIVGMAVPVVADPLALVAIDVVPLLHILLARYCGKEGHIVIRCWYRMDDSYNADPPSMAMASTSSKVDADWYTDTGATDHITSDLDRLALRERYHDNDQVQVGNDSGLRIMHVGHSSVNAATRPLVF
jgi:hypothetical protein